MIEYTSTGYEMAAYAGARATNPDNARVDQWRVVDRNEKHEATLDRRMLVASLTGAFTFMLRDARGDVSTYPYAAESYFFAQQFLADPEQIQVQTREMSEQLRQGMTENVIMPIVAAGFFEHRLFKHIVKSYQLEKRQAERDIPPKGQPEGKKRYRSWQGPADKRGNPTKCNEGAFWWDEEMDALAVELHEHLQEGRAVEHMTERLGASLSKNGSDVDRIMQTIASANGEMKNNSYLSTHPMEENPLSDELTALLPGCRGLLNGVMRYGFEHECFGEDLSWVAEAVSEIWPQHMMSVVDNWRLVWDREPLGKITNNLLRRISARQEILVHCGLEEEVRPIYDAFVLKLLGVPQAQQDYDGYKNLLIGGSKVPADLWAEMQVWDPQTGSVQVSVIEYLLNPYLSSDSERADWLALKTDLDRQRALYAEQVESDTGKSRFEAQLIPGYAAMYVSAVQPQMEEAVLK